MCGICGIFEYERQTSIPADLVHQMNQTMIHRGPMTAVYSSVRESGLATGV